MDVPRTPLRIVLADDDLVMRSSMAALLSKHEAIGSVLEASNGAEAIDLVEKNQVDAVLMDVDMPVLDGIEASQRLAKSHPALPVVMLTVFENETSLQRALNAGVSGFLTKDTVPESIVDLLVTAHTGGLVVSSRPREILVSALTDLSPQAPAEDPAFVELLRLMPQRFEPVFNLLVESVSYRMIAHDLGLTEGTVLTYVSEILRLTGCKSRNEVASRALKCGIDSLPLD